MNGMYIMCERMGETERTTERESVLMVELRDKWTYLNLPFTSIITSSLLFSLAMMNVESEGNTTAEQI